MQKNKTTYTSRRHQNWQQKQSFGRNRNIAIFQPSAKLGPVAHTILVALMILVLGLIYLTQSTKPTSYGYEAQKVDAEIAELENKRTDLEVENARLTALDSIQKSDVAKEMVTPQNVNYAD